MGRKYRGVPPLKQNGNPASRNPYAKELEEEKYRQRSVPDKRQRAADNWRFEDDDFEGWKQ